MTKTVVVDDAAGEAAPVSRRLPFRSSWPLTTRILVGALVVVLIPTMVTDRFYLYSLTMGAIYVVAVIGLNLLVGGGVISIGTAAFMLVGAYTVGLAQLHWHLNAVPAVLLAAAICAVVGFITAFPALRLGPFAVAVVTLMYANVAGDLVLKFSSFTGGGSGVNANAVSFSPSQVWFLCAGLAGVFLLGSRNLLRSPMGRALMMGRRSEPVAHSLGIAPARFKLAAFSIYAALAGVAGALFQMANGPVSTETFDVGISITVLLMVVLGGEGSVAGPLLGGITLTVIPLFLSQTVSHGGAARSLIYGGILLAVVLLVPGGMASLMGQLADRAKRLARRQPDTDDDQDTVASQPVDMPALREVIADVETPASLEVRGVSRSIGGLHILREVSFAVTGGTIHGLIGPNGSGKTTLLNCISGLTKVDAGQVLVAGETMSGVASRNARAGIGRTFQTALLSEADSVRDNLMVGVDAHRKVPYVAYGLRLPPALKEARRTQAEVVRWASALGLEPLLDVRVSSLTPRQRRLVEIGRALATRPRVLLLDEPVAGLTGNEADELESLVRLLRSAGITVVLVEHHAELVMRLCDRVTVLDVGRILITDEPAKVSADASVVAAYLGDELTVSGAGID